MGEGGFAVGSTLWRSYFCWLVLVFSLGVLEAASPKSSSKLAKEKKSDPTVTLFATNAPILTFKIEVGGGEWAALQKDNRSYARATVRVGTNVFKDAGVHLKGNGSFRPLNERPSLVLKFDRFMPDQKFLGLTKLALNSSAQDGTYLAEYMSAWMFRDADVPASRVTHARVTLNGRDLGLYVVIESHNKEFLKRWFRHGDGNLYEAYLQDIDQQIDQDNGDNTSQADRKRFEAVSKIIDPAERWTKLPQVLDVDRYVSHLVCEMFTAHTDGYAMNRNNYRIYSPPDTGRFTFIGHGLDWGFQNTGLSVTPPLGSLVTRAVLTTPEGARLFKERRAVLFTNFFQLEVLTNRVNGAVARLVAQAANPNEAKEFTRYGAEMNGRLVARWQNITNQLYGPLPLALKFDANGIAKLSGWRKKTDKESAPAIHERTTDGSRPVLRISTTTNAPCVASWRTKVALPAGIYSFEGEVRSAGIVSRTNATDIGRGAGLRLSGDKHRENKLEGTAAWTHLQHSLTNAVDNEVDIVCELRALQGEVWFDESSLRLVKRK